MRTSMSENFTINGYVVAEVELGSNGVSGVGCAELPVLVVNLRFVFRSHKDSPTSLYFHGISCRVSPFDKTYIASGSSTDLNVRVIPGEEVKSDWVQIDIPLDQVRLASINRLRNGSDVQLRLDLKLCVDELVQIHQVQGSFRLLPVWGFVERHRLTTRLPIIIPRSQWVEQVLPRMEFGQAHIMELPIIPIEKCAGVKSAVDALQQAQKLESQGFYHEAVAKCRLALEPFFEMTDKPDANGAMRKVPTLKAAWQTRLGQRTYDWLNGSLAAVKQPTNESAHPSSSMFDQADAQMIIIVTTALVAYAVKTQSKS
jgi:hypothetical protein